MTLPTSPRPAPVEHIPYRSTARLPARVRHASLQVLQVELRAVGLKGSPDTYAASSIPTNGPVNLGTDWMFTTPHAQSQCHGIISAIHVLNKNSIAYVVRCVLPATHFFLLVERNRTSNPGEVTRGHRMVLPHLRETLRPITELTPWITPYECLISEGPMKPLTHHRVDACCVSYSESDTLPSTWRVIRTESAIAIGTLVDMHDTEDPLIPIGPARVTSVRTVERSWIEFVVTIHPHYTRTNASRVILAVPLERSVLPSNLAYVHSTARHLLPDVHGNCDIYHVQAAPPSLLRRIQSAIAGLRV